MENEIPEVLPVRTSDRFQSEIRPCRKTLAVEGVEREVSTHEWRAYRGAITQRLTAVWSPIDPDKARQIRENQDADARNTEIAALARIEVFHKAEAIGGFDVVPFVHQSSLTGHIWNFSALGHDPFVDPPAGSSG